MENENQVVETAPEVTEAVSENVESVVETPVKVRRKKMKLEDTKNLILQALSKDVNKNQKQVADEAGLSNRGVINALLRVLITEGKVVRERLKTNDENNKSYVYRLV